MDLDRGLIDKVEKLLIKKYGELVILQAIEPESTPTGLRFQVNYLLPPIPGGLKAIEQQDVFSVLDFNE